MSTDHIVVKAKIKELVGDYQVSADFVDALNAKTLQIIEDAKKRAEANGRKTVMGRDI